MGATAGMMRLRRPRWKDPRLIVGIVLVVASVLMGAVLVSRLSETTSVLVARTAIVPGIQVIALQFAWLAGGIVIVEYLFSYPGIGASLVDAVRNSDFPVVQALAMVIAAVYVVINLLADVLSILLTPRARTAIAS